MARRSGLGRGLGALIPDAPAGDRVEGTTDAGTGVVVGQASTYRSVPLASLRPNQAQPRRHFDEESLASLAESIRALGVLQPVLVRPRDEGFEIIAGERRWRAAKRAGLVDIPVLVREADDLASLEQAVVENLHRQDLNPLEEAAAYQQLISDFGSTHDQVATRVGKSRAAISNTLRLFQLPPPLQEMVADGRLAAGHARTLLGVSDVRFQESLARRILDEGLSVRTVEEAVRSRNGEPTAPKGARRGQSSESERTGAMVELEALLADHLSTRVIVEEVGGRGRMVIEFADLDDLERIYLAMTAAAE